MHSILPRTAELEAQEFQATLAMATHASAREVRKVNPKHSILPRTAELEAQGPHGKLAVGMMQAQGDPWPVVNCALRTMACISSSETVIAESLRFTHARASISMKCLVATYDMMGASAA